MMRLWMTLRVPMIFLNPNACLWTNGYILYLMAQLFSERRNLLYT